MSLCLINICQAKPLFLLVLHIRQYARVKRPERVPPLPSGIIAVVILTAFPARRPGPRLVVLLLVSATHPGLGLTGTAELQTGLVRNHLATDRREQHQVRLVIATSDKCYHSYHLGTEQ